MADTLFDYGLTFMVYGFGAVLCLGAFALLIGSMVGGLLLTSLFKDIRTTRQEGKELRERVRKEIQSGGRRTEGNIRLPDGR